MELTLVQDGEKNSILSFGGIVRNVLVKRPVFNLNDLRGNPGRVRIEAIIYNIQEKMGFHLWWKRGDEYDYIMPLESRGRADFEGMQGIQSTAKHESLVIDSFGPSPDSNDRKGFLLFFDVSKQQ